MTRDEVRAACKNELLAAMTMHLEGAMIANALGIGKQSPMTAWFIAQGIPKNADAASMRVFIDALPDRFAHDICSRLADPTERTLAAIRDALALPR